LRAKRLHGTQKISINVKLKKKIGEIQKAKEQEYLRWKRKGLAKNVHEIP